MFGSKDPETGQVFNAPKELVRLAVPRRVYTASHLDYVAEIIEKIAKYKDQLRGFKITREAALLRHFTVELAEMSKEEIKV